MTYNDSYSGKDYVSLLHSTHENDKWIKPEGEWLHVLDSHTTRGIQEINLVRLKGIPINKSDDNFISHIDFISLEIEDFLLIFSRFFFLKTTTRTPSRLPWWEKASPRPRIECRVSNYNLETNFSFRDN